MLINYHATRFLTGSIHSNCIHVNNNGLEIALVGYSNSGKSTLINCLTNQNMLSRFSKYPGSTKMINFFEVNSQFRLVDLPGYGYSVNYKFNKNYLYDLIINYINQRSCLKGLVLLIDIRRLIRPIDNIILSLSQKKKIHLLLLLTKCDKLNRNTQKLQLKSLQKQLCVNFKHIEIILFSSFRKIGLDQLLLKINTWCNYFLI
ncbi:ribosome biogenesis GTP-binding protein YihA/YsxC [Buchnera aphidicola]|uniref:ribosome biogenesis GTP-binding protein YihA/YsxC n=1 Tax=Buchnera aphidicola TaxID=9 RepID=UPI003464A079